MLTESEIKEMHQMHMDEKDFLVQLANKYDMTEAEVRRLCFFTGVDYAGLMKHTLEPNHVHH